MRPGNCGHWSSVVATEFELIGRYFNRPELAFAHPDVVLGPGDDAAILAQHTGRQLVVSVDTLNVGVHFPADAPPALLAERCLRVNLSDLAAMGAEPLGFTLALSMPTVSACWLQDFSDGLARVAQQFNCPLLGGDTTRGPLSITVQVHGHVPVDQALRRSGAKAGDLIYVTGELGCGAAALWYLQNSELFQARDISAAEHSRWLAAFYRPQPRLAEGQALRTLASAALDISDGIASDLKHILRASTPEGGETLGAVLDSRRLPVSEDFQQRVPADQQVALALGGGDDYELCVCVAPGNEVAAVSALAALGTPFHCIGHIDTGSGIRLINRDGGCTTMPDGGYRHFAEQSAAAPGAGVHP